MLRWRGRQEGPYPPSTIETKLASNKIGLLHEIFDNDRWITIRDYMKQREALLRIEREAREQKERNAREEAERQAHETQENVARQILELANANESARLRTAIASEVRREVWRRGQGQCAKCGSRVNLEYDHIVPVSKGGSNTARNVELLCESCNRSKSDAIE
ncbi:MAG TPA: HNH endonuclease [Verrucomicrobiae bacterium]|nr:HNH endonuclease [Verrucomicrobiae bacterium]